MRWILPFRSALCYDVKHMNKTYTAKSASYLNILLEIDSEGQLITKHYDKRDDVNFPFPCSYIPATPAHFS